MVSREPETGLYWSGVHIRESAVQCVRRAIHSANKMVFLTFHYLHVRNSFILAIFRMDTKDDDDDVVGVLLWTMMMYVAHERAIMCTSMTVLYNRLPDTHTKTYEPIKKREAALHSIY